MLAFVKDFANFADQNLFGEGLVQQVSFWIQNSVSRYEAVRIARHIEHLHPRLTGQQLLCQRAPVQPGHHDIGQEKIKAP